LEETKAEMTFRMVCCRARAEQFATFQGLSPERQVQIMMRTALYVPYSRSAEQEANAQMAFLIERARAKRETLAGFSPES
jgi:hypothetical protein